MRIFGRRFGLPSRLRDSDATANSSQDATCVVVDTSDIHRTGSFAQRPIKQGELIRMMSGHTITKREVLKRIRRGKISPDDLLQIEADLYVDLDDASLAFNHSCAPNAGIRGRNALIAIRDIDTGEEVTFDYAATVTPKIAPFDWQMECNCQSDRCRTVIGNVSTVPQDVLAKYLDLNALQSYIIEELSLNAKS